MKSSAITTVLAAAALATSAAAQTTTAPPVPDSSFYSVFKTGVPSSVLSLILTNPGAASTLISEGYTSGTSFYAGSFPADVQSSLKNPAWRATNQIFNSPQLLTATGPVSIPTTPFRGAPAAATTPSTPTSRPTASPASASYTGGAPVPTGAFGAGAAIAAGLVGLIAL